MTIDRIHAQCTEKRKSHMIIFHLCDSQVNPAKLWQAVGRDKAQISFLCLSVWSWGSLSQELGVEVLLFSIEKSCWSFFFLLHASIWRYSVLVQLGPPPGKTQNMLAVQHIPFGMNSSDPAGHGWRGGYIGYFAQSALHTGSNRLNEKKDYMEHIIFYRNSNMYVSVFFVQYQWNIRTVFGVQFRRSTLVISGQAGYPRKTRH